MPFGPSVTAIKMSWHPRVFRSVAVQTSPADRAGPRSRPARRQSGRLSARPVSVSDRLVGLRPAGRIPQMIVSSLRSARSIKALLKRLTAVEPQDLSVRRERTDPESLREQASVGFSYQGLTTRSWHNGSSTLCPTHRISDTLVAWHFRADPCSSVACPFRVDPCSSVACPFRVDPGFIHGLPFPC